MPLNFSRTAQLFFNPETLLPFFVGSIFLAVLGNAITQILFNILGTATIAAVGIAIGSILIFAASVFFFARGLDRIDIQTLPNTRKPKQYPGLILLVSREEPCRAAIQYHLPQLKYCWLLCSAKSSTLAETIEQDFADQPQIQFKLVLVSNIYDPLDYYEQVSKIYADLPPDITAQNIVADYTGMTAHGSVGVVLASLSPNSPLQYTPAFPDNPQRSLSPIEIVLSNKILSSRNQ